MSDPKFILCHIKTSGAEIYFNVNQITSFFHDHTLDGTYVFTTSDPEGFVLAETLPEFRRMLSDALC